MLLAPSIPDSSRWRQFKPEVILLAVGWYLRFSLSYREVEELLAERGLRVDHVTVWQQNAAAAKRFLAKALGGANHPAPRVINTDGHAAYPPAVAHLKAERRFRRDCRHRPVLYLKQRARAGPHNRFLDPLHHHASFQIKGGIAVFDAAPTLELRF